MASKTLARPDILHDLGDGLVLRGARSQDREAVAAFHANTLLAVGETAPLERLYYFVLDLMSGEHPDCKPGDFMLVEETTSGKIVSSLGLISQTWTYDGIPFRVGQPDIVSTDPAYRRRGLVRAQMNEVHRWSAARGELVQGITGIPWYYRQFGYEMALSLDASRAGSRHHVPRLHEGASEPYSFRPATTDDLPFILEMYRRATSRSLVASLRDDALWRYDLEARSEKNGMRREFRVIETAGPAGKPVDLVIHWRRLWGSELGVSLYELTAGVPFLAATPSVLRYLDATGDAYAIRDGEDFGAIAFSLGEQHPVYETIPDRLPQVGTPYAWFVRVPALPAFVRHIAPALEKRLAASAQAGYTGDLKVSFYHTGLHFSFQDGRVSLDGWTPAEVEEGDAAFPDHTFLQLLFGYRSLAELRHAFPDCAATTEHARALLPILFPKRDSEVWAGG
ncbi:MAG: GNAT family N-acetyltransferase [Thermomicrobiales bacterium]